MNQFTLFFSKHFDKGCLKGITIRDNLSFHSKKSATRWFNSVSKKKNLGFTIFMPFLTKRVLDNTKN